MSTLAAPAPPAVRGQRFLGVLPAFRKDPPGYLMSLARDHGNIVALSLGRQKAYFINDPEIVRDIFITHQSNFKKSRMLERARVLLGDGLLTSEGDNHKRQRRLVQPAFHRERLIGYAASMVECAGTCRGRIQAGEPFDLSKEMMRLTLAIVGRTLFSSNVDSEADDIGAALAQVFDLFELILLPFSEWLEKLPLPSVRRFHKARARLDQTIYRLIAERRANPRDTGDLLSMLLLAREEDGSGGMTDQQVRDEALTLFIAGHETTAQALTWTWYLLSQNPDAARTMRQEIDVVLGGRLPTFDDLPKLRYTEHVFAEGLRLYPPAWAIGRKCLTDFQAGPYLLPAGSIVLTSPFVMHRTERWFPEPEVFRPERWEDEASLSEKESEKASEKARPKFAYFPFGGGTRVCIGERFAWMEGVLVLATLAQKWRFELVPGHPIATQARITLRPRHGMRMTAHSVA